MIDHLPRRSRRWVSFTLLVSGAVISSLTYSARAGAFDYSEHEYITRRAIIALLDPQSSATSAELASAFADMKNALDGNDGVALCIDAEHENRPTTECFVPSDLAALSGDHSASPLLLKWRFFDPDVRAHRRSVPREVFDMLSGLTKLANGCQPPENTLSTAPLAKESFLAAVRNDHLLPGVPGKVFKPRDIDLEGSLGASDYSYLTLASNGCNHFRDVSEFWLEAGTPEPEVRKSLAEERYFYHLKSDSKTLRSKPNLNSFAWYADLHAGALAFADAASISTPSDRHALVGLAMAFELASLHFLEDSVAAGHTITDTRRLSNGDKIDSHDGANECGVEGWVPEAGCEVLEALLPAVAPTAVANCKAHAHVPIFGDHMMFEPSGKRAKPRHNGPQCALRQQEPTLELAEAAVVYSMERTLLRARLHEVAEKTLLLRGLAQCIEQVDPTDDVAWLWRGDPSGSQRPFFYRCAFAWWEAHDDAALQPKLQFLDASFRSNDMAALDLVPLPTREVLAQRGLGVSDPTWRLHSGCGACVMQPAPARADDAWAATLCLVPIVGIVLRRRRTPTNHP
jgi:hypothetical protein